MPTEFSVETLRFFLRNSLVVGLLRTLPALVLAQLNNSPLPFRFAGGFALVVPSLSFIFLMRRYLLNMWGRVTK